MQIILSGYFGFQNTGDEAILYSMIQQIRLEDPSIKITVLSNDPAHTRDTYDVYAVNRWSLKEVIKVIKRSDGLISGGGSLLQDVTGVKSVIYYTGVIGIAKLLQKPVIIYSQGIGPLNGKIAKKLTEFTMNKVDHLTVRDRDSKQLLTKMGIRKNIEVVPDSVMGLDDSLTESGREKDNSVIIVCVRPWPSTQPYQQKFAHGLDLLAHQGFEIVFLPMHGEEDAMCSQNIQSLMKEKSDILSQDLSLNEKINIITSSRFLIGMRLHSLIFSAISNTPFVAVSYDPKIDSFVELMDQKVLGHVNDDSWTGEDIAEDIFRLKGNYQKVQRQLQTIICELRNESRIAVKHMLSVIKQLK
ncbi:polysaccharide pyruvyl transferase CsaB [Halobacillus sp. A1]|uniref:polysaccharide pyruvyl transferase CsaB n=1 Tax=Halobacillus sp. A1 TaxID=2880262 RepID=UPI0020A64986|nr:polysaccharide pyruvyl transferase CsaB [Halobacillus sp. A1]MCP3031459.1 polysaccharide pyruvyl transferase CsaB [Halobacillus sp. A1]